LVPPIIDKLKDSAKDEYLIRAINSVGYDNKRSIDSVLVEVASTTCVDIIEEIQISVICTPICTPK
jgi:hypothetical protein